jgi:hypothetical protein
LIATVANTVNSVEKETSGLPILGPVLKEVFGAVNQPIAEILCAVGQLLDNVLDLVFSLVR